MTPPPSLSLSRCVTPSSLPGLDSDFYRNQRRGEWAAVLVTAVAVGCVGLVVYFLLKNKQKKGFSHRKLVEEYPTDPGT